VTSFTLQNAPLDSQRKQQQKYSRKLHKLSIQYEGIYKQTNQATHIEDVLIHLKETVFIKETVLQ
jgi:hypothetical protein